MICRVCKVETAVYKHSIRCPACLKIYRSTRHQNLKKRVLDAYGNVCRCCGDRHYEFLTIDHIDPKQKLSLADVGGSLYRRLVKENFPLGFQTLCWNCNTAKHYYSICPHELERQHESFTKNSDSNRRAC